MGTARGNNRSSQARGATLLILMWLSMVVPAVAEEKVELGWSDTAELSLVLTDGNSESESLGLKNTLTRTWEDAELVFEARAIRAATTETESTAVGPTPEDFEVVEESDEDLTAELYAFDTAFDREISERLFWKVGGGWLQNRPAGIASRAVLLGGLGNLWIDTERVRFRTGYDLTWTREEPTAEGAESDSFLGARFDLRWRQSLGEHTVYRNVLVVDQNLDDTSDLRADWTNSVAVSINDRFALKVSLQWLWDDQPSLEDVPLEFPRGTPLGETVRVPVDELDTLFTTSLVVSF